MSGRPKYINRELSWLEFNQRVLDEACCPDSPLLERAKFLAITASNLDEFFMVRVGSLKSAREQSAAATADPAGLSRTAQLASIGTRVRAMVEAQYRCLAQDVEPALREQGILRLRPETAEAADRLYLEEHFRQVLGKVVSPAAVGGHRRMPLVRNLGLNLLVRLRPNPGLGRGHRLAVVPIDNAVERVVFVPAASGLRFMLVEDVMRLFGAQLFAGETVAECVAFRIARNAEWAVDEDGDINLMTGMNRVLRERRKSGCVRLEIEAGASVLVRHYLLRQLEISAQDMYEIPGPLDLTLLHAVAATKGFDRLRYAPWPPVQPPSIDPTRGMIEQIAQRDLLLVHPFESYEPVVRLVEEAADDPAVLSIKMTLYRTSRESRIVQALSRAAMNGKYVTAMVELRARFDEARNIRWAIQLEEDGVQVIHGVRGLKTHAKICLIVRREPTGIARYLHFGTGNYNESTARLYADISLLTCNETLGRDATAFFNAVTGYSVEQNLQALAMAPSGLRRRLLELIRAETTRSRQGHPALIMAKLNSLVDTQVIDALYEASKAGVTIRLNVRGICCLRPGVKGLSETITAVSIVDRFLEHSRVFYFAHGGEDLVFISSADWMPRNLDRRVELLVPVIDLDLRRRLIHLLEVCCADSVKGREILADGLYRLRQPTSADAIGSQEQLYRDAVAMEHEDLQRRRTTFEPLAAVGEEKPRQRPQRD
jgi:polyphosphate kinase